MCQHSVQLFAKFRRRNKNSQGIAQTTQENRIKGTTQITDLQESVNFVNEKFQEYEQNRLEKEWEIKELKENIST